MSTKIEDAASRAVDNLLDGFDYAVQGDDGLGDVIEQAREGWNTDEGWRQARGRGNHTRPADRNLAVDFLRHERTDYDSQLRTIGSALVDFEIEACDDDGENPLESFFDDLKNRAHKVIRDETLAAIEDAYPDLAGAVIRRRESTYTVIDGKIFRLGK